MYDKIFVSLLKLMRKLPTCISIKHKINNFKFQKQISHLLKYYKSTLYFLSILL